MVANYGHLPAIAATKSLKLAAVFDPDAKHANEAGDRYGAAVFSQADEFFASGIDAVTITSPAPAHRENVLMAARYGKPVLCEKPISMNERETAEMTAAMTAAKLPFYVGFTYRFSPAAVAIRKMVHDGAVGKVRALRLIYVWNLHGKYEAGQAKVLSQRRVGRMLEGGPMVDCGVHQIDLARWWLGSEVVRYSGHGAWVEEYEAPDHVWLHMDHRCGAHTCVEISFSYDQVAAKPRPHFVYELIGTDGVIRYNRELETFDLSTAQGIKKLPFSHEKNFEGMYEEFGRAMERGSSEMLASAEDGQVATRIATEVTEQTMRHRKELQPG
jgi:predicted dehydrogenase